MKIPTSVKDLPWVYKHIRSRPNLVKIVDNIGWLFFDKVLRMGVGLLVGVWVARHLGPKDFGLLSFAGAFVGLFGAFAVLGLKDVVIRDLVRDPSSRNETLGTAAVLHLVGGVLSYVMIVSAIMWVRPEDDLSKMIVSVVGSMMLFRVGDVALYWFESQVLSKYIVWVQNATFLVFAALKVFLILNGYGILAFAWATAGQAILTAILMFPVLFLYGGFWGKMRATLSRSIELLTASWPLLLTGIAVTIYMKIDQIMLGQMVGDGAVGIYSAAVRISEVWYFIPLMICSSVFPSILETKKRSESLYYERLQRLYDLMVMISVAVALPITIFATSLITFLFGSDFSPAGIVLSIHIWGGVFVSLGTARGKWLIAEELQVMSYCYITCGMLANLCGNYYLIPKYGITGAALATLLSQLIVAIIAPALFKRTRPSSLMLLKSLNPFHLLNGLRSVTKNGFCL